MKKKLLLLTGALLLSAVGLAGCGSGDTSSGGALVSTYSIDVSSEEPVSSASSEAVTNTVNKSLEQGNVTVAYPKLVTEGDAVAAAKANELIAADAKQILKNAADDKSDAGAVECTVLQHEDEISVVYTGTLINKETGKPKTFVATTNIDRKTGARKATGVAEIAAEIADVMQQGDAVVLESDKKTKAAVTDALQEMDTEKLISLLKNCDFTEKNKTPDCFSYFLDEDGDQAAVYVPVESNDYTIVCVDLDKLA